jgi:putative membrane protein
VLVLITINSCLQGDTINVISAETMKKLFLRWIILTVAVVFASFATGLLGFKLVVDTGSLSGWINVFLGAAVFALVNATLGRVLKFFTAPLNCLTLGIMSLVINSLMFWWVGTMGFGFKVDGFPTAFVGSIFLSIANGLLGGIFLREGKGNDEDDD